MNLPLAHRCAAEKLGMVVFYPNFGQKDKLKTGLNLNPLQIL